MMETKEEWEQAREIEKYLNDYDQEIIVRRKISESKYFYLFKEAKKYEDWAGLIYFHRERIYWTILWKRGVPRESILVLLLVGFVFLLLLMDKKQIRKMMERFSIYWFRFAFSFLDSFHIECCRGFLRYLCPC